MLPNVSTITIRPLFITSLPFAYEWIFLGFSNFLKFLWHLFTTGNTVCLHLLKTKCVKVMSYFEEQTVLMRTFSNQNQRDTFKHPSYLSLKTTYGMCELFTILDRFIFWFFILRHVICQPLTD